MALPAGPEKTRNVLVEELGNVENKGEIVECWTLDVRKTWKRDSRQLPQKRSRLGRMASATPRCGDAAHREAHWGGQGRGAMKGRGGGVAGQRAIESRVPMESDSGWLDDIISLVWAYYILFSEPGVNFTGA